MPPEVYNAWISMLSVPGQIPADMRARMTLHLALDQMRAGNRLSYEDFNQVMDAIEFLAGKDYVRDRLLGNGEGQK